MLAMIAHPHPSFQRDFRQTHPLLRLTLRLLFRESPLRYRQEACLAHQTQSQSPAYLGYPTARYLVGRSTSPYPSY